MSSIGLDFGRGKEKEETEEFKNSKEALSN